MKEPGGSHSGAPGSDIGIDEGARDIHSTWQTAVFGRTCDAAQRIPAFFLRVSLHGRFWEEMEKVMA